MKVANDSAIYYFQKARNTTNIRAKLSLFEVAAKRIKTSNDSLLAQIRDNQIYYYNQIKKYDSALFYSDLLLKVSVKNKDTLNTAKSFYRKARTYFYLDNQEEVLKNTYQSKKLYLLVEDSLNAGKRLVELANTQDRLGDFSGSQASATEALRYLSSSKDSLYIASALNVIAVTDRIMGDYPNAIQDYKNALRFARTTDDSLVIFNNIANTYINLEEYDSALKILDSIKEQSSDSLITSRILDNYFYTKWKNSKEKVLDTLENIASYRKKLEDFEGLLSSYDHIINIQQEMDKKEARTNSEAYLDVAKRYKDVSAQVNALKYLINLSSPLKSKEYAKEFITLTDSISKVRNRIKNVFAKIKYDEEQKIKEINNLEKVSAERKLQIIKQKNQKIIIFLILLIFLILTFFTIYYLLQKHKKEKIIQIHETEARLSKKVHDEIANDLYYLMTQVNRKDNIIQLDLLEDIYSRTRNISRENNLIRTDEKFEEDLRSMLNGIIQDSAKLILKEFNEIQWSSLKSEHKIIIYRVLQELLINMKKHSGASMVLLEFKKKRSTLIISYRDNGIGIEFKNNQRASGLLNVENRIQAINGKIIFPVEEINGTRIIINIPT